MTRDQEWITNNFEKLVKKYEKQYIAVIDQSVAGHGKSPKKVYDEAISKFSGKKPSILLVPSEKDMECLI